MKSGMIFLALLACVSSAWGQAGPDDGWQTLNTLVPGERVRVATGADRKLQGRFASLSDQAIAVLVKNREVTILRADVASVSVRSNSKRGRNAAIGGAAGAGIALAIGLAVVFAMGGSDDVGAVVALPVVIAGAASAALGWFSGARYTVIYSK